MAKVNPFTKAALDQIKGRKFTSFDSGAKQAVKGAIDVFMREKNRAEREIKQEYKRGEISRNDKKKQLQGLDALEELTRLEIARAMIEALKPKIPTATAKMKKETIEQKQAEFEQQAMQYVQEVQKLLRFRRYFVFGALLAREHRAELHTHVETQLEGRREAFAKVLDSKHAAEHRRMRRVKSEVEERDPRRAEAKLGFEEKCRRIAQALSEKERAYISATMRDDFNFKKGIDTDAVVEYVTIYLRDPMRLIKLENFNVNSLSREIGKKGVTEENWYTHPASPRGEYFQTMVGAHVHIEELSIGAGTKKPFEASEYVELANVPYFFTGDRLPGRAFVLGDPRTYTRELLRLNKMGNETKPFVLFAKSRFVPPVKGNVEKAEEKVLHIIYDEFQHRFPYKKKPDGSHRGGEEASLTIFLSPTSDVRGVCRHRAAMLTVALQERGFDARYIQGVLGGIPHAWIEVKIGNTLFLVDPAQNIPPTEVVVKRAKEDASLNCYFRMDGEELQFLHRYQKQFNKVWRHRD